jgi:hypothetical protein
MNETHLEITGHWKTFMKVVALSLALTGCATVQPWKRGRLAHECMTFEADASRVAYETHWQESREAAAGGFGVQSGGCGCK